jgi:AcrR family transcriptional regulator
MARGSFREQVLKVREDAIVSAVNRLLAEKGFDLMTVDEVAADVGIAKASLYKHFASKEALAAAAMVRVLERTATVVDRQPSSAPAIQKLEAVTRWALEVQLAGEMPTLPSQNSSLRAELLGSRAYLDLLMQVSDQLGAWIEQAQADGAIDPALPTASAQRTSSTGVPHFASTLVATEPMTRLVSEPWPCEPITIRSNLPLSA